VQRHVSFFLTETYNWIRRCMYFKVQKFTSQNLLNQAAVFCVRNALKVIYEHLKFENFSRGLYPRTAVEKGEGRHGEGRKGMVLLRFNLVPHRFLWASYGPDCMSALRLCVCATITFYPAIHSLLHVHFHNSSYQCPQQQWNVHFLCKSN
jgi:hypothetical protein